jgi:O-antigen/teichoic acid export membrane protein
MTPQDHNKTLGIIYSLIGGASALFVIWGPLSLIFGKQKDFSLDDDLNRFLLVMWLILLLFALLTLSTAVGMFRQKRWARKPAMILAVLFIWWFPLGTALGVYTWWFMHSEACRQLYSNPRT